MTTPFPASLEVRVRPDAEQNGRADAVVARIGAMPGVADVRYDRQWLASVSSGPERRPWGPALRWHC
jgi:cell division protein FtsX